MKKWLLQNLQQPVMLKPFVYCHVNSVFMGFVGILEENKLTRYIKIQCVFANQLNICTRVKYLLARKYICLLKGIFLFLSARAGMISTREDKKVIYSSILRTPIKSRFKQ